MGFHSFGLIAAVTIGCVATQPTSAAQLYVARDVTDTPTCGAASPASAACKTLTFAVSAGIAHAGDKIICRDPGGSQALSITEGIEIDCSSARQQIINNTSSTGVSTFSAVVINVGSSTDKTVRIRGLDIASSPTDGTNFGVHIRSGTAVYLEDITVSDTGTIGILDARTSGQTKLFVTDSIVRNIAGPGIVAAATNTGMAVLDNVRLENNVYGLATATANNVTVNRSVLSGNLTAGVEADSGAQVVVNDSVISNNGTGIQSNNNLRFSNNDIDFNNTAISGASFTLGNNRFSNNGAAGTAPTRVTNAPVDIGP